MAAYEGRLRRAILAFKDGRRDVGLALGRLLCERLEMPPLVVPVPTTRRRAAERGFDGSELLAAQTGSSVWNVLTQIAGDSQRGRSRSERLSARRRFACAPLPAERTRVVLLDDVATTGTTLEDCAATLRDRGAIVEQAIVLARAMPPKGDNLKATWNGTVIAESDQTRVVENNHYFPPQSVKREFLTESDTRSVCPWKGTASYYTIVANGAENPDAAWYYAEPKKAAADITGHVAFWKGVQIG